MPEGSSSLEEPVAITTAPAAPVVGRERSSSLEERVAILERQLAARDVSRFPAVRFAWELFVIAVVAGAIILVERLSSQARTIEDLSDRVKSLEHRGGR
jgi:hypothetical protein